MKKMKRNFFVITLILLGHITFAQKTIYNVKEAGASGNKKDDVTKILQKTIDECAKSGGGVVYFPSGEYTSGMLTMRSNITLHLEVGATLYATRSEDGYIKQENYEADDQIKTPNRRYLIWGDKVENFTITGRGTINGQAEQEWLDLQSVDMFIEQETKIAKEAGVEMKRTYQKDPRVRLIFMENCKNVLIEGIRVIHSPDWSVHFGNTEHLVIRGIYIYSSLDMGCNADGIDIDGCRHVHISDCTIETGDDGICLKSLLNENGTYSNCENITITNCTVTSTSTGLKLGTESHGDFYNIIFSNCALTNCNRGIGIFARDGSNVRNVIFSNLTIDCNRKHFNWWGDADPIHFVLLKRNPDSRLGSISDVLVENVIARGQGTSTIQGFPTKNLTNITLSNVKLYMEAEDTPDKRATHGLEVIGVDNFKMENCEIYWNDDKVEEKWQNGLYLEKINTAHIDGLTVRQAKKGDNESAAVYLNDVRDLILERSVAQKETETFVKITGENSKNIILEDNYTSNAKELYKLGSKVDKKVVKVDD